MGKRKKTKIEKGILAMLLAPEIIALVAIIVSGLIYLFLS